MNIYYTDGSFDDGLAGWSAVKVDEGCNIRVSMKSAILPSSYSAELEAVILAVEDSDGDCTVFTDSEAIVGGFKSRVINFIEGRKIGSTIPNSDKQRWRLLRQYSETKSICVHHARDSAQVDCHKIAHTASLVARHNRINFVMKSAQATREKCKAVKKETSTSAKGT